MDEIMEKRQRVAGLREQARGLAVKRARQMARLRARGWTLARIGQKYGGLTRQAVHNILRDYAADVADILGPSEGSDDAKAA